MIGGANTDYLIRGRDLPTPGMTLEGDVFLVGPGGKGSNRAVGAAWLGARTALIGRVGNDQRGRALVASLGHYGYPSSADIRIPANGALILARDG